MTMNCEDVRILIGAEPGSDDPVVAAHIAQCQECARYRHELRAMDRLIAQALNVGVAAAAPSRGYVWKRPVWGVAASLLVAMCVTALIWLATPRQSFAQQVINHVRGEPQSLVRTSKEANAAELAKTLARSGLRLKPGAAHVSYVMSCWFRGHFVPHLVVQSEHGPVTVLVLPRESAQPLPARISEDGFDGVVMPAPRGVLVVLGQDAPVDEVAVTVLNALEYTR